VPVVFELVFVAALTLVLHWYNQEYTKTEDSRKTLYSLMGIAASLAEVGGLVLDHTSRPSPERLARLSSMLETKRDYLTKLEATSNPPELKRTIAEFNYLLGDGRRLIERVKMAGKRASGYSDPEIVMLRMYEAYELLDHCRAFSSVFLADEARLSVSGPEQVQRFNNLLLTMVVGGVLLNITLCIRLATLLSADVIKRLDRITSNASLLSSNRKLFSTDGGSDEIAQLDAVLHVTASTLSETLKKESAVLNHSAEVICSLDSSLKFITISQAARAIWKYDPRELVGKEISSILAEPTRTQSLWKFQGIREHSGSGQLENIVLKKDGTPQNTLWSVSWSQNDSCFFCVGQDVTHLRTLQRLKRTFLAAVSHDLRAPLTSISMSLAKLKSDGDVRLPESFSKSISAMQFAVTGAMFLTSELLDLEKLQTKSWKIRPQPVSLSEVYESARGLLAPLASFSLVSFDNPDGDAYVLGDEKLLTRCLMALLRTAMRLTQAHALVQISISSADHIARACISFECDAAVWSEFNAQFDRISIASQRLGSMALIESGVGLSLLIAVLSAQEQKAEVSVNQTPAGSTLILSLPALDPEIGP